MRDRAAQAAPPVAMEMARVYSAHLSQVTLRRTEATPGQFGTPAPRGSPPAYRTGVLAGSVTHWPGPSSGLSALAYAGPHTIYAATQEYGAVHFARDHPYMRWHERRRLVGKKRGGNPRRGRTCSLPWPRWLLTGRCSRAAALMFRSLVGHY